MNKIYVCGDIHGCTNGDCDKLEKFFLINHNSLSKNDFLVVLGDFGLIWDVGESSYNEKKHIEWLSEKPWTTLFIAGNHENYDRLNRIPISNKWGGKVGWLNKNIGYLPSGHVYTIGEKTFFTFGGGYSIDKSNRLNRVSWWEEELPSFADYQTGLTSLANHDFQVDYILTHTCPNSVFEYFEQKYHFDSAWSQPENQLRTYLEEVNKQVLFKHWYFGHFHMDENDIMSKFSILYDQSPVLLT